VPFPDFDPILLQIGPVAIRWYALAYVAGILLGWRDGVMMVRNTRLWGGQAPPATPAQIDDLILWITLGVIAGGRLGYVLFYAPHLFVTDPLEILQVWHGGMSFHGGLLGVIIAVIGFARGNKIDMFRLGDLVAPCAPIGLFFGRIANFINGELWGRPTDVPWGIVFPAGGPFSRHPSQLYEAALEGLVLFALLRLATHRWLWLQRRGATTGLFMLGYGIFRMTLENVRQPDEFMPHFPLGLTMGILLSLPMALGGAFLIWRAMKDKPAAHEPA
jgi:phosphatidylglycerol:prolipoprotein diacylglycerol transferase